MQAPNSNSTLELVINEQQMQNMSQIDLTRPGEGTTINGTAGGSHSSTTGGFSLQNIKRWPERFKEGFNAKVNEAKSKSETKTEFVFEMIHAFSGIIVWILCFICTITLPIFLLFIGLANLDDCADRPSLPYLVFATGFIMTASNLFNLAMALDLPILTNHQILTSETKNTIASIINMMYNCVVAFLYILCGYMVYTIDSPSNPNRRQPNQIDPATNQPLGETVQEREMDCDRLLYHFTFWFITLSLSLIVILCIVAGVLYAYNRYRLAIIRGSTPRSQPNTNPVDLYASNRV